MEIDTRLDSERERRGDIRTTEAQTTGGSAIDVNIKPSWPIWEIRQA